MSASCRRSSREGVVDYKFDVEFVDREAPVLIEAAKSVPHNYFGSSEPAATAAQLAGAKVDNVDPLAVLDHGKVETAAPVQTIDADEAGHIVRAPMQGAIVSLNVAPGDAVSEGKVLLIMDSMKMEHEVAEGRPASFSVLTLRPATLSSKTVRCC